MRKVPELLAVALLAAACVVGCSTRSSAPASDVRAEDLPAFTANDAQLMDDSFSPEVFGAAVDPADPIDARARLAEGVQLVRVATVTRDQDGETEHYVVEVTPAAPPVKGQALGGTVALTLEEANAAYPLLRAVDSGLVGAKLVLFFRRYNDSGRVMLHWRVEVPNQRVQRAVENAKLMNEIGR